MSLYGGAHCGSSGLIGVIRRITACFHSSFRVSPCKKRAEVQALRRWHLYKSVRLLVKKRVADLTMMNNIHNSTRSTSIELVSVTKVKQMISYIINVRCKLVEIYLNVLGGG